MEISEHVVGDVTVLTLKGRMILDEGETPLRERVDGLVRQGRLKLVVDMLEVTYVDSAGLGTLVGKYVSLRRRGGDLKLLRLTERSAHLLHVTKLSRVFETFESEEAAVRSFARAAVTP